MRRMLLLIAIGIQVFAALPAAAQDDPCIAAVQGFIAQNPDVGARNIYALLGNELNRGCILGPTDTSGIEELYQVLFANSSTTTERAVARSQLLARAIEEFAGRPSRICDAENEAGCMVGRHVDRIGELRVALMTDVPDPSRDVTQPDGWTIRQPNGEIAISNIDLNAFLTQECAVVTEARCNDAIALSGSFMRTSVAMNQVIAAFNQPTIAAHQEFLSLRDREWDAYFNQVSVQFPWELYINSRRFSNQNREDLGGFPRAPNDRWIVLRPSAGFEFIDTPVGSSTSAAVLLEIAGFERWRWRDGKATNRWGLSGAVSFANIPGMDNVGYGLMLHTPIRNVSIGAVWRDGEAGSEIGVAANFNFAALFQQYEELDLDEFLGR